MLREGDLWTGYRVSLPGQNRKYHVRRRRGRWRVTVWHRPAGELADGLLSSSTECSDLIAAVNRVARRYSERPGGSFYFNEYNQVLKPVYGDGAVELRFVGEFPDVRFLFRLLGGELWSNRPPHDPNGWLAPGDDWTGPRCGIPYWFQARKSLRIYRSKIAQTEDEFVQVRYREYLDRYNSDYGGLAEAIWCAKGRSGGRFYVTEAGSVWAPYWQGPGRMDWNYRYVGTLWEHVNAWFPKTT